MSLLDMLLPVFLMHMNSTLSAVVNVGSGLFLTKGAVHLTPPRLTFTSLPTLALR